MPRASTIATALLFAALALGTGRLEAQRAAARPSESLEREGLHLVISGARSQLDVGALMNALRADLGRPVVPLAVPPGGRPGTSGELVSADRITIDIDQALRAAMTYQPGHGTAVRRQIELGTNSERWPEMLAALAVNLVRDQASELERMLRERRAQRMVAGGASASEAPSTEPAAGAASPQSPATDQAALDKMPLVANREGAQQVDDGRPAATPNESGPFPVESSNDISRRETTGRGWRLGVGGGVASDFSGVWGEAAIDGGYAWAFFGLRGSFSIDVGQLNAEQLGASGSVDATSQSAAYRRYGLWLDGTVELPMRRGWLELGLGGGLLLHRSEDHREASAGLRVSVGGSFALHEWLLWTTRMAIGTSFRKVGLSGELDAIGAFTGTLTTGMTIRWGR